MKYILFFSLSLLITLCFACNNTSTTENIPRIPVIVDTFNLTATQTHAKIDYKKEVSYYPYYFGDYTDTILINYNINALPPPPPLPPSLGLYYLLMPDYKASVAPLTLYGRDIYWDFFADPAWCNPVKATNNNLHIHVDTTQTVLNLRPGKKTKIDKSYPILLYNLSSKDTVNIGKNFHIHLLLEAQNKAGKWQAIERYYDYGCGIFASRIILPPQNIAITSAIIFEGNFKTKLRLKMDSLYSNTFTGWIDVGQFKW